MDGDTAEPASPDAKVEQPTKSFYALLPSAFAYPFRELGWAAIVAGAVVFWVVDILASLPTFIIFVAFQFALQALAGGYLAAFMIKVLGSSAGGSDAPPDWPDLASVWEDILKPLFLLLGAGLFSFLPMIVACGFLREDVLWIRTGRFWLLLAWGVMYLPMGLIAVALWDSVGGLNPVVVLRGIAKTFPAYLVAMAMFFACFLVGLLGLPYLSRVELIFGTLVAMAAALYLAMVAMRILGLLYRTHAMKLGWFEWAPSPPAWANQDAQAGCNND